MPASPTPPGGHTGPGPSVVHTIVGVQTGVAAFVGPAPRGPVNTATAITSWLDYVTLFGGQSQLSRMSRAVWFFYLNGGRQAEIVRVTGAGAQPSTLPLGDLTLTASSPGTWGDALRARIDRSGTRPATPQERDSDGGVYNLTIRDTCSGQQEEFPDVSTLASSEQSLPRVLAASTLVTVDTVPGTMPRVHDALLPGGDPWATDEHSTKATGGTDAPPTAGDFVPDAAGGADSGIYALRHVDIFTMLCVPDLEPGQLDACLELCVERRAMLIVDPPAAWSSVAAAQEEAVNNPPLHGRVENAAVYFPPLVAPDPLADGEPTFVMPSGAIAGIWARTDVTRGVWKAPAGITDGLLTGATGVSVPLTDLENGQLNPIGVNCLRQFPGQGPLVWGARTMAGADDRASAWKYLPVRRTALFLEETLFRGTSWVRFEPNDEALRASIRLDIEMFMGELFRKGAFQGTTREDAYLINCDATNNPQADIDRGIVNILVGFAPLRPAEFVLVRIQQQSQPEAA